ncbi:hypothetical protein GCM10009066_05620 [Halarchaeum salinum]|uniref:DUF2188 domain-containing protein n=1 Tax=Halarchaeum salinum TaxID=489912 RepID=A0AAV3S5Q0_9EURY
MSLRSLLRRTYEQGQFPPDDFPSGRCEWSVGFDVDDYTGPGWYVGVSSPYAIETYGPYESQQSAVSAAKEKMAPNDELEVNEKRTINYGGVKY